jgi:hypothetical protein
LLFHAFKCLGSWYYVADSVLKVSSDKMAVNVPSGINDQSPTIALF